MPTYHLSLARAVGLGAACAAIVLYRFVFAEEPTWPIAVMILLALLAAWASLTIRPFVLCAVFASFFPIGLYLMFTRAFLKWVGVCDVLYLVSAAGSMLVGRGYRGSHNSAQSSNS